MLNSSFSFLSQIFFFFEKKKQNKTRTSIAEISASAYLYTRLMMMNKYTNLMGNSWRQDNKECRAACAVFFFLSYWLQMAIITINNKVSQRFSFISGFCAKR